MCAAPAESPCLVAAASASDTCVRPLQNRRASSHQHQRVTLVRGQLLADRLGEYHFYPVALRRSSVSESCPSSAPGSYKSVCFELRRRPARRAGPRPSHLCLLILCCSRRCCNTRNREPHFPYYDIHCYPPFEPRYCSLFSRPFYYNISNPRNYYRISPPSPPGFP